MGLCLAFGVWSVDSGSVLSFDWDLPNFFSARRTFRVMDLASFGLYFPCFGTYLITLNSQLVK